MVLKPCAAEKTIDGKYSEVTESSRVLKPCATETMTEGASSKLAEPMEVASSEIARLSSCTSKRKAEFDPEEEEESGEGKSKIEEAEVKIDYLFEAPEWDVDSFDGLEYYSSSELSSSSSDDEVAMEHYRIAKRQLIESKGFYVDRELTPSLYFRRIHPVSSDCGFGAGRTFRTYWEEMVHVCLQKHNKDKGSKVEFVELVRGNYRAPPRSKSYITFMAREKPDGPLVEYQAKCMVTYDAKRHPILCRPTPLPKH